MNSKLIRMGSNLSSDQLLGRLLLSKNSSSRMTNTSWLMSCSVIWRRSTFASRSSSQVLQKAASKPTRASSRLASGQQAKPKPSRHWQEPRDWTNQVHHEMWDDHQPLWETHTFKPWVMVPCTKSSLTRWPPSTLCFSHLLIGRPLKTGNMSATHPTHTQSHPCTNPFF